MVLTTSKEPWTLAQSVYGSVQEAKVSAAQFGLRTHTQYGPESIWAAIDARTEALWERPRFEANFNMFDHEHPHPVHPGASKFVPNTVFAFYREHPELL